MIKVGKKMLKLALTNRNNTQFMSEFIKRQSKKIKMLSDLGLTCIDELVRQVVPDSILLRGQNKLPDGCSEQEALTELKELQEEI